MIMLAGELYRRDHGADPPSDEALVGPYLKELPDDGLGRRGPGRSRSARRAAGIRPSGSDGDDDEFER